MRYVVVVHKDIDSDYGVTVPDLPGCFSAGETFIQALENVVEAIECHLEGLLLDKEPIPTPMPIEDHFNNPDHTAGVWAFVDINLTKLSGKAKRINITMPERILKQIDHYTHEHGGNRSAFLVDAALNFIAEHRAA